jgi:hypothetical protein
MIPAGCTCDRCIEMCKTYPCMPLPEEAQTLIQKGYGNQLMLDTLGSVYEPGGKYAALRPAMVGFEHDLAPSEIGKAPCIFFNNNRCQLHPLGLKPYEGRNSWCVSTDEDGETVMAVLKAAWSTGYAQGVARMWINRFYTGDPRWRSLPHPFKAGGIA